MELIKAEDFFKARPCDRCGDKEAIVFYTMSWFTYERICMKCSEHEQVVKKRLRALGLPKAMEGCGFVPKMDMLEMLEKKVCENVFSP